MMDSSIIRLIKLSQFVNCFQFQYTFVHYTVNYIYWLLNIFKFINIIMHIHMKQLALLKKAFWKKKRVSNKKLYLYQKFFLAKKFKFYTCPQNVQYAVCSCSNVQMLNKKIYTVLIVVIDVVGTHGDPWKHL